MRIYISFLISIVCFFSASGQQKQLVNNDTRKSWQYLMNYGISNDGKFVWYKVSYGDRQSCRLITSSGQQIAVIDEIQNDPVFSTDNKMFFVQKKRDTLLSYNLTSHTALNFPGRMLKVFLAKRHLRTYLVNDTLVVEDVQGKLQRRISGVIDYVLSPNNKHMILKSTRGLTLLTVPGFKKTSIISSSNIIKFCYGHLGNKIAIFSKSNEQKQLRIFDIQQSKLYSLLSEKRQISNKDYYIFDFSDLIFSKDDRTLFVQAESEKRIFYGTINKDVQIVSDQNPGFMSVEDHPKARIAFNTDLGSLRAFLVSEQDSERMLEHSNDHVIVMSRVDIPSEGYWNKSQIPRYWLVSLFDGKRKELNIRSNSFKSYALHFSYSGKFIIYNDSISRNIFAYEIGTEKLRNLTSKINIPADIISIYRASYKNRFDPNQMTWSKNDQTVTVFDRYDAWQLDPLAVKEPRNLTKSYGRNNSICFRPIENISFSLQGHLLLAAFDNQNKNNGFWTVQNNNLKRLSMQAAFYYFPDIGMPSNPILKAKNANQFLITKQTASESVNLYLTSDFKTFKRISEIYPEKNFNWFSSELITYPLKFRDEKGQAILYKPENFDPKKRYPVIFTYYQDRSQELHKFLPPDLSSVLFNVPWYVSHGYLVCVPDIINNKPGRIKDTTLDAVESAAKYLNKYTWVDSTKAGLNGHSFGGYETNLLVANSTMFAAAHSASGISDCISFASSSVHGGGGLETIEAGQANLNATVWSNTKVYVDNSPIFNVDRISTPILLSHALGDTQVPYEQSLGFYCALRRAGKKVWFLKYNDGSHTPGELDLTIRQQQFFNHYLKNGPIPKWMLDSNNTGYELDSTKLIQ